MSANDFLLTGGSRKIRRVPKKLTRIGAPREERREERPEKSPERETLEEGEVNDSLNFDDYMSWESDEEPSPFSPPEGKFAGSWRTGTAFTFVGEDKIKDSNLTDYYSNKSSSYTNKDKEIDRKRRNLFRNFQ